MSDAKVITLPESAEEIRALAEAARQAGIFAYPRNDEGKQWTYITRIYLDRLSEEKGPDARTEALRRLHPEPNQRAEHEWWPTQDHACAAAAVALGLSPVPIRAPWMAPPPADIQQYVEEWSKLLHHQAAESDREPVAYMQGQRLPGATVAAVFRYVARLMDASMSPNACIQAKVVPLSSVEMAFRQWVTTANQHLRAGIGEMNHQVHAVEIDANKAWTAIQGIIGAGAHPTGAHAESVTVSLNDLVTVLRASLGDMDAMADMLAGPQARLCQLVKASHPNAFVSPQDELGGGAAEGR